MQFPVGVALRDLANFAAGQVTRAISRQKSSFSRAEGRSHSGWCHENMLPSESGGISSEEGVVNLQTVVFTMLSLSCDFRANIMVSLGLTQWEFWSDEAVTHNTPIGDTDLLREMEPRLPVTVHMCRQATGSRSHFSYG